MENTLLFVYGTLRPAAGHPVGQALLAQAVCVGEACLPGGRLYDAGGYPALAPGTEWVVGDVLVIPEAAWAGLDAYEEALGDNPLYERRLTRIRTASGQWLEAWAYWYRRSVAGMTPVKGGDWLPWRS